MKLTPRQNLARYALSILLAALGSLIGLAGFYGLPARVAYQVREQYRFSNPGGESTYALGVLLPKSGSYQEVGAETTSVSPQEVIEAAETRTLHFEGRLPPGEFSVELAYPARLRQGSVSWTGETTPSDLAGQEGIEVDAPQIQALAAQMPGTDREAVFERFRYTARALQWPTGSRENVQTSAVQALQDGVGGCAEFSFLFTALNRAAGVPTRSISGLALPLFQPPFVEASATWSHPGGAHAWVEFYTDGMWTFGDASWASQSTAWQYFGRADGSHLSYGDFSAEAQALQANQAWAEARGEPVGGMSAPLKFFAASAGEGVTLTPSVTLNKTWDGRWLNGLLGFAVMMVLVKAGDALLIRRLSRKRS